VIQRCSVGRGSRAADGVAYAVLQTEPVPLCAGIFPVAKGFRSLQSPRVLALTGRNHILRVMNKIRIGIVGYGNLGRGAEKAIAGTTDMELVGVFSRRALEHPLYQPMADISEWREKADVLLLCGGSATDLPEQGPSLAAHFNLVDSFDTHARIPEYFEQVNAAAAGGGKVAVISTGWDPGLFSIARVLGEAILPHGKEYTFWGRGVSQGHSDALRRVSGVRDARQYTIPSEAAINLVRSGETPDLTTRQKHTRQCFVVLAEGADAAHVEREIVTMPNYFADYDTTVTFISQEELDRDHAGLPHGGFVLRSGQTSEGNRHVVEFGLKLGSNPEFTSSVLVAYARAVHRLAAKGESGARTVFDIPVGLLSPHTADILRRDYL
jgi:diaminopimelate dehydrogenase